MVEGPVSNRRYSRRVVRNAIVAGVGIIVVVILLIAGGYTVKNMRQASKEEALRDLQTRTEGYSDTVAASFMGIADQLGKLAKEPATIALFEQENPDLIVQQEEMLVRNFRSAQRLRLLQPGRYGLDSESRPPLSFASLNLLNRAENSDAVIGAEVHSFGSPDEHIVMVERVTNTNGEVTGLLHLSLETGLLQESLSGLSLAEGYAELQQRESGSPLILAKQGNPAFRAGEPLTAPVRGTRWNLAYWEKGFATGTETESSGLPIPVLSGVLILVILGIAALFVIKRRQAPGTTRSTDANSGSVVYGGAIQAIMDGAHPGVEELIPNLPKGKGVKKQAPRPVSKGAAEGDDITRIARKPPDAPKKPAPKSTPEEIKDPDKTPVKEDTAPVQIPRGIFRAYDIRGLVGKELNPASVTEIGKAIGSEADARNEKTVIVGRDGRESSPELAEALIQGLCASGRDVIDIGMVPTPVLYFATHHLDARSGVMLTGSHNGPEYNGLKIVLGGETLSEEAIQGLYKRIVDKDFITGNGDVQTQDLVADYIRRISEDIPVALGGAFKLVVDCGNGIPGAVAPELYRALGHDVIELYCDVDGKFPNHHPDPSQPKNLQDLINRVKEEQADLGFAFDGDGDRLGVVDTDGNIIWPDRQMMLLARDVLSRNPGAEIIFDVKCSRHLRAIIESSGGKPLMWKTGHSLIKGKMKETGAPLAGEMSGHIFFKERWYGFDDALYTGARMLEVLMAAKKKPSEVFAEIPEGISTPELRVDLTEEAHRTFMEEMKTKMDFEGAEIFDIDGFRVEFPDAWGLVRPSNTTPCLVLRFEADDQDALDRIQGEFRTLMLSINPDLQLPF